MQDLSARSYDWRQGIGLDIINTLRLSFSYYFTYLYELHCTRQVLESIYCEASGLFRLLR